jgi:hypothetical protein
VQDDDTDIITRAVNFKISEVECNPEFHSKYVIGFQIFRGTKITVAQYDA